MIQQAERRYSFFVPGKPDAQGSMKGFVRGNRAILVHNSKSLMPWRNAIAYAAREAGWDGRLLLDGALLVRATFQYRRPQSHYWKSGQLKTTAPPCPYKTGKDTDKLQRAVGDALNGVVWTDDRRIVSWIACRVWDDREGALITVERLTHEVFETKEEA